MAWVREGEPPDEIKVSFVISAKKHPGLARWVWSLPYRGASGVIRDVLAGAVNAAGGGIQVSQVSIKANDDQAVPGDTPNGVIPSVEGVTGAASEIIKKFDTMFPGGA